MLAYISASGLALTLALFVYSRNIRARLHRYHLLFTIFVVLWLSGSIIEKTPRALLDLHFRLLMVFALLLTYYLLLFVFELAQKRMHTWMRLVCSVVGLTIAGLSLFTDTITRSVYLDSSGAVHAQQGLFYAPAAAWVSLVGLVGVPVLIQALRTTAIDKQRKRQIKVVLTSLLLSAIAAILTGFVAPYLAEDLRYYEFTPLASLIFSFGFGYAILRLKMFNLKAVAARGVAYVLALLGLVLTYSLLANVLTPLFSSGEIRLSGAEFVSSIITTVILVLFYPMIKHTFDKFTNRLFFRDSYDPQLFLGHLNKILVKSIDIDVLLSSSCQLIETYLKVEHVGFYVRDTSYYDARHIGSQAVALSEQDANRLSHLLPQTQKKVIYVDEFERVSDQSEIEVREILRRSNIEVLVRVVSTLEYKISGIGYILLGQKLSGNMYDTADLRLLEIVGNELEIAVENALRFEEIQQFNITLQDKIEEATSELKKSNAKLKELDQAKDEFVSMASHQLRTPLTAVKGYISMVLDGDGGKPTPEQKRMLTQALVSSQRMVHLITDLLNVSRIKTKKFSINLKATYLPDVVQSELSQLKDSAKSKHLKLHYDKPSRFPTLNIDEVKLRQVIMNFIDNAIFYTPEGGTIKIELKNSRYFIEFTVEDTGMGVAKEDQHNLFSKFYRAANARRARPDGTGLGLFMAKKIVHAQGGSIIFHSELDSGSTFGFRLPKSKLEITEK